MDKGTMPLLTEGVSEMEFWALGSGSGWCDASMCGNQGASQRLKTQSREEMRNNPILSHSGMHGHKLAGLFRDTETLKAVFDEETGRKECG
jgi:hypothetical protein